MANVIVVFASNALVQPPRVEVSDRAAIGLALSRFDGSASGFCSHRDRVAASYGLAAKVETVKPLSPSQTPDFDIALVGQYALNEFGHELVGTIAEAKGATLVFDVLDVRRDGSLLRIIKDVGQGKREEWLVSGPVVLVVSADAVRPTYVSRYRRMLVAPQLPVNGTQRVDMRASDSAEWQGVRPRAKFGKQKLAFDALAEDRMSAAFGIAAAATGTNDRVIVGDAATCAQHLLRYLAHHGFLPNRVATGVPTAEEYLTSATASKPQSRFANTRHVSVSKRISRSPRSPHEVLQRIARRPRTMPDVKEERLASIRQPRGPRPVGQSPAGLLRRPRRQNV